MAKTNDEHSQGGGYHGGPKRWTGTGPRPARHIPWPELFKHHTSVLTGHLKMMDMVRKHCEPQSGNYEMADACVNRTQEMLRDFKKVTFSFVPPKDNVDRVPLGASSASMYPGYSPADHIYGEAAQEFGSQVAQMKGSGKEWKPQTNGPEYVVGQSKLSAQQQKELYEKQKKEKAQQESTQREDQEEKPEEPLWFVDSNPTPVGVTDVAKSTQKGKRGASAVEEDRESGEEVTRKKKKSKASSQDADGSKATPAEEDDIANEVEARLKAKEEKRKKKEDKKRKRDSGDQSMLAAEAPAVDSAKVEKPKKKKQKAEEVESRSGDPAEKTERKEKKDKKKREKSAEVADGAKDEGEKRSKKRKKDA